MPVFVMHNGKLIDRRELPPRVERAASDLPAPSVHSFTTYASPIDDTSISSHRQRDKDLHKSGSYDPRDTPAAFRKARDARRQSAKRLAAQPARYS